MTSGLRSLGEALGVTSKTAHKYVNDPRWVKAGLSKTGPWSDAQVEKARVWRRKYYPSSAADAALVAELPGHAADPLSEIRDLSPVKKAQLQLVVERAAKLKIERELLLGGYLKKEDVDRGRIERVASVRQELANIRLLALKMEGKGLQDREQILEDWARAVCRKFERPDPD
jgi:hypothetical protein